MTIRLAKPAITPSMSAMLGAALGMLLSAWGPYLGAASGPIADTLVVPMIPSGRQEQPQLFRMNPDGTGLTQLTRAAGVGAPTDANDFPVLARDRKTLLFASGRAFPPSATSHNFNPMLRMAYRMDPAGGEARRLTGLDPQHYLEYPNDLAPDGSWAVLAVVNDGTDVPAPIAGLSKLYRANLDGSACAMLIPDDALSRSEANLGCAVFTGDGGTLVFVADGPAQACELWKLDLATSRTTQLTHEADRGRKVAWRMPMVAPDDESIYCLSQKNDYSAMALERIRLDGTGGTEVLGIPKEPGSGAFTLDFFALAPDGNALVCSQRSGSMNEKVVTMGMDGKDARILYPTARFVGWGGIAWR